MQINGSFQGNLNEIEFVKYFNLNKLKFNEYLKKFNSNINYLWMCQVNSMQMSSLAKRKVFTRADVYLINSNDKKMDSIISTNKGYLGENLLEQNKIEYQKIDYSGVSIKILDSHFQIIKLQPKSFFEILGCFELGAGASLYVDILPELAKNKDVIEGWFSSIEKMNNYFKFLFNDKLINFDLNQEQCKKIKSFSNIQISKLIYSSPDIQKKIFNGYSFYQEPYTAWYFSDNYKIIDLNTIPFSVTTGSGRSKGDFTIVLKPKQVVNRKLK